jgi:predicted AAA+ superfamily ATPase
MDVSTAPHASLITALAEVPAVALLGPRQAGKTTLALEVAQTRSAVYLGLESDADRARVVYGGVERFPLAEGVEAVSLGDLCEEISAG